MGAAFGRDVDEMCAELIPVEDGTVLDVGAHDPEQLVVSVTMTEPGRLEIDGVDLTYSHGWQRGTQTVGTKVTVSSR